ncbi:MAG TPA: hypothetical protein VIP05_22130 [Burkholderiaceae bacterium]
MRPLTLADLAALAAGQALALVTACASTWGMWLWLTIAQPFK